MSGIDLRTYKTKEKKTLSEKKTSRSWQDILNKDISLFGSGLSDKKKEAFYKELQILLNAGVDIHSALKIIIEEQSPKDRKIFEQLESELIDGKLLSEALQLSGKFSSYEYFSIMIGEESGRLPEVLKQLASFFETKIQQQRKFVSALSYPLVVVATAVLAVVFMMAFVVPMFSDVYSRFGGELPWITELVLSISSFIGTYIGWTVLFIIGLIILVITQHKKTWFRHWSSAIGMRTPIMGSLIKKIYLARLCQSMHLMLSSDINLVKAVDLATKMIGFYPLEESLEKVGKDLLNGLPLHESMSGSALYNRRMIALVKVGEETNHLDDLFGKLSQQYAQEVDHQSNLLGSVLEPLLIIMLGLIIGIILVALYLPIFQLGFQLN